MIRLDFRHSPLPMIRVATDCDAEAIGRIHVVTWRAAYAGILPADFRAGLSVRLSEDALGDGG